MPTGLWEILKDNNISLTIPQIKIYMKMLLEGIAYVHEKNIIHRVHCLYEIYLWYKHGSFIINILSIGFKTC